MKVAYSKDAIRALRRMPTNVVQTIQAKIAAYAADPSSQANNVRTLRNADAALRLRVGDWRILMDASDDTLTIRAVRPRSSAYD